MSKRKKGDNRIRNKRATFDYQIELTFDAGISLSGPEVKSVRNGKASISQAFCIMTDKGLIIKGMYISEFARAGYVSQNPSRDRALLLNKSEIKKLRTKLKDVGYSIIPLEVFFSETGYAKLKIGLGRGKKNYDKRESLKEKDDERELRNLRS